MRLFPFVMKRMPILTNFFCFDKSECPISLYDLEEFHNSVFEEIKTLKYVGKKASSKNNKCYKSCVIYQNVMHLKPKFMT